MPDRKSVAQRWHLRAGILVLEQIFSEKMSDGFTVVKKKGGKTSTTDANPPSTSCSAVDHQQKVCSRIMKSDEKPVFRIFSVISKEFFKKEQKKNQFAFGRCE